MSYEQSATLALDTGFTSRVRMAVLRAAIDIAHEAPVEGQEVRYSKRQNLAQSMISSSGGSSSFAFCVASNATIAISGVNTPDGDIEFVIGSLWDALAGVTFAEGIS